VTLAGADDLVRDTVDLLFSSQSVRDRSPVERTWPESLRRSSEYSPPALGLAKAVRAPLRIASRYAVGGDGTAELEATGGGSRVELSATTPKNTSPGERVIRAPYAGRAWSSVKNR